MAHQNKNLFIPHKTALVFWVILGFFSANLLQSFQLTASEPPSVLSDNRRDEKTVIVIRSHQVVAYDDAIKGFQEGCKDKGITVRDIYDLNGDAETGKKVVLGIKNSKSPPDLVLVVGVLAATLAKEYITDIPVIFCLVINHERFNFKGSNIVGISSEAATEDQFSAIKELLGGRRRLGVIYDPIQTEKLVAEAIPLAKKYDFDLITKKIASEKDVAAALDAIINKIDVLWMIPDSTVITQDALSIILKKVQIQHIPTFCTSSAIVKAGALASIAIDYTQTGFQAAKIAQSLLFHSKETPPGVRHPEKLKWTLNTKTAKWLGINIAPFESRSNVTLYP
ncbi:MAG: hypothetical protein HW390_2412 [Candidatus Brocadiaceae bacterium]|nr:hypothetical protein [Candidatus Brocadiaceae bacterium]